MPSQNNNLVERMDDDYRQRLRGLARQYRLSVDEEEEMSQEVYVRMHSIDPASIRNPEGYLITVALNWIREEAARSRRRRDMADADDPLIQDQLADEPDVGALIDREQLRGDLLEVLSELRPKCRSAVLLHYWHGMTYGQVAERLDISIDMVKKYIKQALAHYRRRLGPAE